MPVFSNKKSRAREDSSRRSLCQEKINTIDIFAKIFVARNEIFHKFVTFIFYDLVVFKLFQILKINLVISHLNNCIYLTIKMRSIIKFFPHSDSYLGNKVFCVIIMSRFLSFLRNMLRHYF